MGDMIQNSYCRACEGLCGVQVHLKDGSVVGLSGDTTNPLNAGFSCEWADASLRALSHQDRLTQPLKRVEGKLSPVTWDEALSDIGQRIRSLGKANGQRSLGVYGGASLGQNSLGALRTGAFALGMGTPNLFTPLAMYGAPLLFAAEMMLGYPAPLQSDVGRAHYTLLLGGEQEQQRWGPLQSGTIHTQALRHIQRQRRGAKWVTVSSRTTPLGEASDQCVRIRPHTETYFLLGMCHAILSSGWEDKQYLQDHCLHLDEARKWLEPWTPAVVSEICGIEPDVLSGITLKFSRAAMATVARSPSLTLHKNGTVSAWAWHLLHALTANLLRPGGAFEANPLLDLQPFYSTFPVAEAPSSSQRNYSSLLLQLPGTVLAEEIQDGEVRALICVGGDPLEELPGRDSLESALASLDLLVALDSRQGSTAQYADYVLPTTLPWERPDLQLLQQPLLPYRFLQATPKVLEAPATVRSEESVLADLFREATPGIFGGDWGQHLLLTGRWLATADLEVQLNRLLEWSCNTSMEALQGMPHGLDEGDLDRATWRVEHNERRIDLAPSALRNAVLSLKVPSSREDFPLVLDTLGGVEGGRGSRLRTESAVEPGIGVHPDLGFAEGSTLEVETPWGKASGPVRLCPDQHPELVHVPWGWAVEANRLVSSEELDPFTGTPNLIGTPCRLQSQVS